MAKTNEPPGETLTAIMEEKWPRGGSFPALGHGRSNWGQAIQSVASCCA